MALSYLASIVMIIW